MKKSKHSWKDGGKKMMGKDKILIQVFCVIAALATWFFVVNEVNPISSRDITSVPLVISNADALADSGYVVAGKDVSEIRVTIEGYRNEILNITRNDIGAYIDVQGYSEGLNRIPIELSLPEGVTVIDYTPKQVLCELEAIVNRTIDLTIDIDGRAQEGYYVGAPNSSINSVIIRGPRSVVNSAVKAVALFSIDGSSDTLDKRIPIDVYSDTGVELDVRITPEIAEITVPIYPTKIVDIVVPVSVTPREGYGIREMEIEPGTVLIAANRVALANLEHVLTEPIVLEDVTDNVYRAVEIVSGNYIVAEAMNPVVTIFVERIIERSFEYNHGEIEFINIPEGYDPQIMNQVDQIDVNVTGLESYIEDMIRDDIKLLIDLEELNTDDNTALIYYETEREVKEVRISVERLLIELVGTEEVSDNSEGD